MLRPSTLGGGSVTAKLFEGGIGRRGRGEGKRVVIKTIFPRVFSFSRFFFLVRGCACCGWEEEGKKRLKRKGEGEEMDRNSGAAGEEFQERGK